MNEKNIIVDENDKIIWYKLRKNIQEKDIYRASALWITNSKNEILLAQRSFKKINSPGQWWPAVSWTLAKGETYLKNIIKETKEELGVYNIKPIKWKKTRRYWKYNHFTQWFTLKLDKKIEEFIIQEEEVEKIEWLPEKEFLMKIKSRPEEFVNGLVTVINNFGLDFDL